MLLINTLKRGIFGNHSIRRLYFRYPSSVQWNIPGDSFVEGMCHCGSSRWPGNLFIKNNRGHFPVPMGNAILRCSCSHTRYATIPAVSSTGDPLWIQIPSRKSFFKIRLKVSIHSLMIFQRKWRSRGVTNLYQHFAKKVWRNWVGLHLSYRSILGEFVS